MAPESNNYSPSDHEFQLVIQDPPSGVDGTVNVQHVGENAKVSRDEPVVTKRQSKWSGFTTFSRSGAKGGEFSFSVEQQAGVLCQMLDAVADAFCEVGATYKDPDSGLVCKGKNGRITGPADATFGGEAGTREYTITFAEVLYEKE